MSEVERPASAAGGSLALLALENVVLTAAELSETPSILDGVPASLESDLRIWGCGFIQDLGLCLRVPQTVVGTAQVIFQRFFYRKSMRQFSVEGIAVAAVFLSCKVEEHPRRPRDVINSFHYFKCKRFGVPFESLEMYSATDYDLQSEMFRNEKHLLRELSFHVQVQHPHKLVINYLKLLGLIEENHVTQRAWNYLSDSFRTTLYVKYQPHVVACACIMLASRDVGLVMPTRPPWWLLFDVTQEDLEDAAREILFMYSRDVNAAPLPVTAAALEKYLRDMNDNVPSDISAAKKSRWDL